MPDELIVLGSSSASPTARRFPTSFALKVTDKLFLIDCGAPASSLLYRYGFDPQDVQAIFLSHWHMDHIANLGLFLTHNHNLRRSRSLKVYGPRGTRGKIDRLLNDSFLLRENLRYKLKVSNVKSNSSHKEALLKVKFFKTQHLENPKLKTHFGRKATSLGMILDSPSWRIVYSGDINSPQELGPHVKGCNLLIHEITHAPPEAIADFAESAQIPHLLICHIDAAFDGSPERIKAIFARRYSGNLMIAEDGLKVSLRKISTRKTLKTVNLDSQSSVSIDTPATATFLEHLQSEFNLPLNTSRQIVQVAQTLFTPQDTSPQVEPGKTTVSIASLKALPNMPLDETDKVSVVLTIDNGPDDAEIQIEQGKAALRRKRIRRLQKEAMEQGGVLTQNDLAQLLNVNVRTIRRDIQALNANGHPVTTRGTLP